MACAGFRADILGIYQGDAVLILQSTSAERSLSLGGGDGIGRNR